MSNISNRKGKFHISSEIMRDAIEKDSATLEYLMSKVLITKCEFDYISDQFIYSGYSELFDELLSGEIIPEYTFQITVKNDSEIDLYIEALRI